jgi:hypothetical protein
MGVFAGPACAQNESLGQDAGHCTLKDHIYTCDGARFHEALLSAQTVAIDVHNWDGVASTGDGPGYEEAEQDAGAAGHAG